MNTRGRVAKIISEFLSINKGFDHSKNTTDLGGDSLDGVEILMGVEAEFGLDFPDSFPDQYSVDDIVEFIDGL